MRKLVLEVGKKYVVRDPEGVGIVWVRVDAIRPETSLGCRQVSGSIQHGNFLSTAEWSIDGIYEIRGVPCQYDLVAEYQEPGIHLSPEHVGKKVRLRNGNIQIITEYIEDSYDPQVGGSRWNWNLDGTQESGNISCDIVEILD